MAASLSFAMMELTADSNGTFQTAKLPYVVTATDTEANAIAAAELASPDKYYGLYREEISLRERLGLTEWLVDVSYLTQVGEITQSFDTTGATEHVEIAREEIATHSAPGYSAPNVHGVIGVEGSRPGATVQGVDIVSSIYQFSETHYLPKSTVTAKYRRTIAQYTGRYNTHPFRGFDPVEVLFMGASGRIQGTGKGDVWEIEYRFAYSETRNSFSIGDITIPRKRGWEYLWVMYSDVSDSTAKRFAKKPIAAYINRVYRGANFADLKIGTAEL